MSCHKFKCGEGYGVVTLANIYRFKGYTFEFHNYLSPVLCRKDMEPHKVQPVSPKHKFWPVLEEWQKLTKKQKEETRIYG